jgi:hypothetical protein
MEGKGINGAIKPLVKKEDGSTDVGDVSYIVPEISLLLATTAPFESPWHSWIVSSEG